MDARGAELTGSRTNVMPYHLPPRVIVTANRNSLLSLLPPYAHGHTDAY
jgi:hypothetical protein